MVKQLKIEFPRDGEAIPSNLAYYLYAAFCQILPDEVAESIHSAAITPLSEFTSFSAEKIFWTINAFGSLRPFVQPDLFSSKSIEVKKLQRSMSISACDVTEVSEADLIRKHFIDQKPKTEFRFRFITPCAFKSSGEYVFMPTASLIIKSLIQRWGAYSSEFSLDDEKTQEDIISSARIQSYNLKSTGYEIKGVVIPAFTGQLTLKAKGPEPLLRIISLLADFANYAGVGIKTALGMGAVEAT